ncbi:MAG: HAD family hydrolase [Oscillospiraceae bacterium]|nr:HAD family hydrolase [Oscillospiraceae bacterium]
MRISFDLDDTLFINPEKTDAEPELKFPLNLLFRDRLRKGTIELMQYLKQNQIEIWIYTTSFRSEKYIKNLFSCYGIRLDGIINGARHAKEVQAHKAEPMPSKYPSHYRIALHVDDDKSVLENGRMYGFRVYLIPEQDPDWTKNILKILNSTSSQHSAYPVTRAESSKRREIHEPEKENPRCRR